MARQCTGTTKKNQPCKAPPREGKDTCISHAPREEQESVGFGGSQPGSGRPALPKPHEILRERIESEIEEVIEPLFDALKADRAIVVGDGSQARLEFAADHAVRLRAVADLLDRVYGKSKQQTEVTGAGGGPVETSIDLTGLTDEELAVLRRIHAPG